MYKLMCMLIIVGAVIAASPGDIVVNEIMYNGPESGTDNEWAELYNTTGADITLDSSWTITDGEGSFSFEGTVISADGYLTVKFAENDVEPFPFTPDVDASEMGILLGNSGDQVILLESGTVIDSVDYSDDWPGGYPGHDGSGPSLERIDPAGPSNSEANWGASTGDGGTPGAVNSIYGSVDDYPPEIADMGNDPEAPTPDDTVIVSATITDDGTITKAMCFYSVDMSEEDSLVMFDDGAHGDMGAGDDVYGCMIDPVAGGSTVRYYLVVEDDSLHSDTTWTYAYTVTTGDTIDGDLVINEIMYNPAGSDEYGEYVELYNRSGATIDAGDWVLKDNVDYNTFMIPAGTSVGAGEYLVLAKDPDTIEVRYSITGVLGPVDFSLNNGGDMVRLYNDVGTLMDFVDYSDSDPWPTDADGDGPSLELIDPGSDNNVASNWATGSANGTPGSANTVDVDEFVKFPENIRMSFAPNPFNAALTVNFYVPENCKVRIEVFDILGNRVAEPLNQNCTAGNSSIICSPEGPAGLYLVKMTARGESVSRKALYIK